MMEIFAALMLALLYGVVFALLYLQETYEEPHVDLSPRIPEGPWKRFNKVHFG